MRNRIVCRALLITLLLTTGSAGAAILEQTFMNDFETNAIYLWSLDTSNMSLDGFSASADMGGWKAGISSPAHMVLSGPTVAAAAGRFNLLMSYKTTPFRLEWAEVLFDRVGTVVKGYGTLSFNGNGWSNSNVATHLIDIPLHPRVAATPLPSSVLMMFPALALVTVKGLRKRSLA